MKIYSALQIRAWDAYTIEKEPVASLDLMNRAARAFTDWFLKTYSGTDRTIVVFAGTGNNGGDGLAVARMLDQAQFAAKVVVCDFGGRHSDDFEAQLGMIPTFSPVAPVMFPSFAAFKESCSLWLKPSDIVIDALFGTGLSRPLEGDWAQLIAFLNQGGHETVSIDLPSGLFCDAPTPGNVVVHAARTFAFERPKLAFFFPENAKFLGEWTFESIGLHAGFEQETETPFQYLTMELAKNLRKPRSRFSHKGSFGHALLVAGSWGKMGASVLTARACLRSGVGLLTVHAPRIGNIILQSTVPEAMSSPDQMAKFWSEAPDLQGFSSIGVGPGIGKALATAKALQQLLQAVKVPLVLDADALNLLAENPLWFDFLPENTILTPHPKEFERLFGKTSNGFDRHDLLRKMAQKHQVYIVLKGANTAIACPDGSCWFNSTGNSGMATGGAGDVLTGLVTGLLGSGYSPKHAALLGVFLHGLAGDLAAASLSQEAMTASDLVNYFGQAWLQLQIK